MLRGAVDATGALELIDADADAATGDGARDAFDADGVDDVGVEPPIRRLK